MENFDQKGGRTRKQSTSITEEKEQTGREETGVRKAKDKSLGHGDRWILETTGSGPQETCGVGGSPRCSSG